jgi:hypothetical protein
LLAAALLAVALPTSANAGRTKSCEGIGDTITKLQSKGPCAAPSATAPSS